MEKRLILAIALSILVLLGWSLIATRFYPIENKQVTIEGPQPMAQVSAPVVSPPLEQEPPSSLVELSQGSQEITFLEQQAAIREVTFPTYQSYKFLLRRGFLLLDTPPAFKKEGLLSEGKATFVYGDAAKQITKRFTVSNSNYNIELEVIIQNLSSAPLTMKLGVVGAVIGLVGDPNQVRYQDAAVAVKDRIMRLNVRQKAYVEEVKFLSWRDRYFCGIIEPSTDKYSAYVTKINPQESEISLVSREFTISPGGQQTEKFVIYLGPQELSIINSIRPEWAGVIHYGTFDFISRLLLKLLGVFYRLTQNWGWAIVVFSFAIYFILYPLSLKQMRAMKEMQAMQPRIEELRAAHKDNPQKLNKAIMELYREHKVNPLGGCLPMILQIPIFFALYQALIRSVALKGARFLWIKDLSEPDRLFTLPTSLPILGNEINILPILMTVGMFIQQKISMAATTSSSSAEQQKLMMIIFPIMFGFIFYHMPSGLVLYWFINSTLMLIYQLRVSRTK